MVYKKGYENGEKVIEINEGKIDLVLYNESKPTFYFYRFNPTCIVGEPIDKSISLYDKKKVDAFLRGKGLEGYDNTVNMLLAKAWEEGMNPRDDM